MCALFLQPPEARKDFFGRMLDGLLGWFFRLFNRTFEGAKSVYIRLLKRLIRWSLIVLLLYAGLLLLTGYMFKKVPTGFIPEIDQGVIFVNVELPEGASLERTEKVMNQLEDILKSTPGMAHTINRIGSSIITQATASNSGTVICIFEPFEERKKDPKKSLRGILAEIEPNLPKFQRRVSSPFHCRPFGDWAPPRGEA
jgi:multidrug efflux pump